MLAYVGDSVVVVEEVEEGCDFDLRRFVEEEQVVVAVVGTYY